MAELLLPRATATGCMAHRAGAVPVVFVFLFLSPMAIGVDRCTYGMLQHGAVVEGPC